MNSGSLSRATATRGDLVKKFQAKLQPQQNLNEASSPMDVPALKVKTLKAKGKKAQGPKPKGSAHD